MLTQSDDPAENRARDLARRAADKARTIPRCLLAGELAENRNQRAIWIDRAEELAKKGAPLQERIDVLLARAGHTRGGANWRDAIPYYDKVLALDPDNVPANLARVELYSEAGLRETALTSLDLTLARRPRSSRSSARRPQRSASSTARPRPRSSPAATRSSASTTRRS